MNIETLQCVHTGYSADTIEWCPKDGFHEYFICGTYHLEENRTMENAPTRRKGRVNLYKYDYSNDKLEKKDSKETAAILDTKWSVLGEKPIVAAATALGEILLFELKENEINLISSVHLDSEAETLLTLAIDWNTNGNYSSNKMLLASDSLGSVSLLCPGETNLDIVARWKSHSFEAWTCCFDKWNPYIVYSGGDDTLIHVYDIREMEPSPRKMLTNKTHMAGVTSLTSLPTREHILATGSYDDHLRLFDVRSFRQPLSTIDLSGGVWRIKPNPFKANFLLCSCMYHNTSIVQVNENCTSLEIVAEYFEHKSINYGADWSYKMIDTSMIIGTCSFYDQKLCVSKVWKTEN